MMLEGRAHVDSDLIGFARTHASTGAGAEPQLSLVLARYARTRPVHVVCMTGEVVDLNAPPAGGVEIPPERGRWALGAFAARGQKRSG